MLLAEKILKTLRCKIQSLQVSRLWIVVFMCFIEKQKYNIYQMDINFLKNYQFASLLYRLFSCWEDDLETRAGQWVQLYGNLCVGSTEG